MPSNMKQPILYNASFETQSYGGYEGGEAGSYSKFDYTEKGKEINDYINGVFGFIQRKCLIRNRLLREFLAEILGTLVFISFSLASVAQYLFSGKSSFLSVNVSFGFGLTLGIIIAGKISGGHLNPAVSFSMFLTGQINLVKFLIYVVGQYIGAFFAALFVYLVYLNELQMYSGGMYSLDTAGIFATYPTHEQNVFSNFFDQFFATLIFIICILSITDKKTNDISHPIVSILIGLLLLIIGSSFGYNCGFAVNPARDLAPRIFTSMAGWGSLPFTAGNSFFWIPIIGPMIGSLVGTLGYTLLISNHLDEI